MLPAMAQDPSGDPVEIRQLGIADLRLVLNANPDVFDHAVVPVRAAEFLGDPRHVLIAALDEKSIVGFLSAVIYVHPDKEHPELWVNEVGVAEPYRQRGIGRRLMEAAIAAAQAAGCSALWVLSEADNSAARALYRSVCATETADVVQYEISLRTDRKQPED